MTYNRRPNYRANYSKPASPRVLTADGLDAGYSVAQQSYLSTLVAQLTGLLAPLDDSDPLAVSTVAAFVPLLSTVDRVAASESVDSSLSTAIDNLKRLVEGLRANPHVVQHVVARQRVEHPGLPQGVEKVMVTRFDGKCSQCRRPTSMGVDLGVFQHGSWSAWCLTCADTDPAERLAREAAQRAAADAERAAREAEREALNVLSGVAVGLARQAFTAMGMDSHQRPVLRFALPSATGNNDLDFFTVSVTSHRGVSNGVRVCRVIGGHADQPLALEQGVEALKRLTDGDIVAACRTYGQHLGYCCRCGRHLTDEASRAAGIGPDCANK